MRQRLVPVLAIVVASLGCMHGAYDPPPQTDVDLARSEARVPPARATHAVPQPAARIDLSSVHAALDAYGTWDHGDASQGEVWVPSPAVVGAGFVPYGTNGHWVRTDAGWYWQSEFAWGWLVFHYGRWIQRADHTWGWLPGDTFAPAWVDWRVADNDTVGWAPLGDDGPPSPELYVYVSFEFLLDVNVWSSAVYGPAAGVYYPGTRSLEPRDGYGGASYGWGPHTDRGASSGSTTDLATAWSHDGPTPRAGAPTSGGASGPAHATAAGGSETTATRRAHPDVIVTTTDVDPMMAEVPPLGPGMGMVPSDPSPGDSRVMASAPLPGGSDPGGGSGGDPGAGSGSGASGHDPSPGPHAPPPLPVVAAMHTATPASMSEYSPNVSTALRHGPPASLEYSRESHAASASSGGYHAPSSFHSASSFGSSGGSSGYHSPSYSSSGGGGSSYRAAASSFHPSTSSSAPRTGGNASAFRAVMPRFGH